MTAPSVGILVELFAVIDVLIALVVKAAVVLVPDIIKELAVKLVAPVPPKDTGKVPQVKAPLLDVAYKAPFADAFDAKVPALSL